MKVWKVNLVVYVVGDNRLDAIDNLVKEMDYAFCHLDSPLHSYDHPIHAELDHEQED